MELFGREIIVLLSFTAVTQAFYWDWGGCPEVTVKSDFVIDNYVGTWYEIAHYPTMFQSDAARCTQAVYSKSTTGANYIDVANTVTFADGTVSTVRGEAWIPDTTQPGKLLLRYNQYMPAGDYWVLDTNYDLFALVHTCRSVLGIFHTQADWILSRNRMLDDAVLNQLFTVMTGQGLATDPFIYTDQTGCDTANNIN